MKLEVLCNEANYSSVLECIFNSANSKVDTICTPSGLLSRIDESLIKEHLNFSAIVDYPYGISDTNVRIHDIILAKRRGAKSIDLVINRNDLEASNLASIRKDFKSCASACNEYDISLRPVIEYRVSDWSFVMDLCYCLKSNNSSEIVIGTGTMVDDIVDNIICCKTIEDQIDMPVVSCSPILSQDHYDIFYKSNIYGIRIKSYKILDNLCNI